MWRVPISYIGNSIIYLVFQSVRQSPFLWNVIFSAAIQDLIIDAIWSFMRRFSDFCSLNYFNRLSIILLCASLSLDVISPCFQEYTNDPKDMKNTFIHLTNYSVNKNNEEFIHNKNPGRFSFFLWSSRKIWSLLVVLMS